jgi:hypothetical protein
VNIIPSASAAFLFYALKWYNFVVMNMDDYKNFDNFQRTNSLGDSLEKSDRNWIIVAFYYG